MRDDDLRRKVERGARAIWRDGPSAAVVVALAPDDRGSYDVVLEVRASTLEQQPGEVCCPGGHVDPGERPEEAAVRETCEELLVLPKQVQLLDKIGVVTGPAGLPLHVYVAVLEGYEGTFSPDEVTSVFRLPMDWIGTHDPRVYTMRYDPHPPADFPWDRVEGGRSYHWRDKTEEVPFYDTKPVVWGATARVLQLFSQVLRAGGAA